MNPKTKRTIWLFIVIGLVLIATAIGEWFEGRWWWCGCPQFLGTFQAWSSQTSKLFLDPYSFTHILHGVMFCGLVVLIRRRAQFARQLLTVMIIECCWELIENTNAVIQRYRVATASLEYHGDTIMNSMGDILCCAIGAALAWKLGWRKSIALFVAIEVMLLFWIRDSLVLEMLMLIHPFPAIKSWQLNH